MTLVSRTRRLNHMQRISGLSCLLTFIVSDHFNPRTAAALHYERPALRFGCCEWMVQPLLDAGVERRAIDVYTPELSYEYRGLCTLTPQPLTHCVPNCGYHIWIGEGSVFYATDTATLDGIEAKGYDLYMIEANHVKAELEARRDAKVASGEYAYEFNAARNHMSQEQAEDWLYQQMGTNSRYVFLHQHSTP